MRVGKACSSCANELTRLVDVLPAAHIVAARPFSLELGPRDVVLLRLCRSKGLCIEPQGNDSGQPRPSTRRWFELSHAREIYPACQRTELFDLEAKETQYGNIHSSNARVFWAR